MSERPEPAGAMTPAPSNPALTPTPAASAEPAMGAPAKRTGPRHPVIAQAVAVVLLLLLGAGAVTTLVMMREAPTREASESRGPLVETLTVSRADVPLTIEGFGDVEPHVQAPLVPQVAGRIESVHPNLVTGGFIRAGEPLVQLEREDYEIAMRRAEATVAQAKGGLASATSALRQAEAAIEEAEASIAQAQTRLETERAEAAAALAEWRSLHENRDPPPLLVRQPQIREALAALRSAEARKQSAEAEQLAAEAQVQAAEADVQAAEAQLREAALNLERTTLSMPFDGRVLEESIDIGQYVGVGQSLAMIYGTDMVQVTVPLSDRKLQWLDLPLLPEQPVDDADAPTRSTERRGVPVTLTGDFAGQSIDWRGLAVRTTGQVDPRSRLVHVVVEIADPLTQASMPLTPGMFVSVAFDGRTLDDVATVPRRALREANTVWVATAEDELAIRSVDVAYMDREQVYIRDGLSAGDRVILSGLDVVADGMAVRPAATEPATRQAEADGEPQSSLQPTSVTEEPDGVGDGAKRNPPAALTEVDTAGQGESERDR